jgi:hypothetical protein
MAGYTFSGDAVTRIRQTVRTVEGMPSVPQASRVNSTPLQWDYMLIGKTDAALSKGASGTISIYSGTSASGLTDTGENVTAYNRFGSIASNRWVAVWTMPWGYEVHAAECT